MNDNEFYLRIFQTIATVIMILIVSISIAITITTSKFIASGYTRDTLPGTQGATWVKK